MRVGLLGPLPPLRGGIAQYNQSLREALTDAGHEVLALSYRKLYPRLLFPGSDQFEVGAKPDDSVDATLLAWDPISWLAAAFRLRRFKPDVIVVHHWHPFFVPGLRAILAWSGAKTRVVIAHNVLPHEPSKLAALLNPGLFRHATRVLVGSTPQRDELKRVAPGADGIVAPHPAYTRFFDPAEDAIDAHREARDALNVPDDRVLLVHLGLVREYKGLDLLLAALGELTKRAALADLNWELRIAGEFYDEPAPYLKQIETLGLADRVTVRNQFLGDDEMAQLIRAADAVVLPYRHATQSGVAMAALAGGAPVIATRTGALVDVVREDENGLLADPGDVASLTDTLTRFLQQGRTRWTEKRQTNAVDTRARYSWQAVVTRIEEAAQ